jgi:hypothetical protein
MNDVVNSLNQEPQFIFIIVVSIILFGSLALTILGVVGMLVWRKHRATRMASEMKLEMIAAGMSADEIERVLAAKITGK